jgi:hypothetical protein
MDGIGYAKLSECLCLKLQQVLSAVIYRTTNASILPSCMIKARKFIQFSANMVGSPSFLGELQVPREPRKLRCQLGLEFSEAGRYLLVYLASNAGRTQEPSITKETDGSVDIVSRAKDSMASEGVVRSTGAAEKKEDEDDIAETRVFGDNMSSLFL